MSTKKYKVNIGKESYLWAVISLSLLTFFSYDKINQGLYFSSALVLLLISLIWYFSFFYPKYYIVDDAGLYIRSLGERKNIDIKSITKIEKGNSIWKSGFFYFWYPYQKGLNIQYNTYDEIFINPEDADEFIAHLLHVNPDIKIK